jgi:hypothetical protein
MDLMAFTSLLDQEREAVDHPVVARRVEVGITVHRQPL